LPAGKLPAQRGLRKKAEPSELHAWSLQVRVCPMTTRAYSATPGPAPQPFWQQPGTPPPQNATTPPQALTPEEKVQQTGCLGPAQKQHSGPNPAKPPPPTNPGKLGRRV